ncbi:MAG: hypothetical protein ACFFDH_09365 [Promethearchaeota archaeon]
MIKQRTNIQLIFLLVLFCVNIGIISKNINYDVESDSTGIPTSNLLTSGPDILIDKVYTFTVDQPILFFNNNIWLEAGYFYNLSIGVVTPHTCSMIFSFWDPYEYRYDMTFDNVKQVFDTNNYSDYRRDKFLAVFNSTYPLQFEAITNENLNIHIRLEKGNKWPPSPPPPPPPPPPTIEEFNMTLHTDYYYKICFERGSGSVNTSGKIWIDHFVKDPNNITFNIYNHKQLGNKQLNYMFGTATEGMYIFNMTYHHEAESIIVGVVVYEIDNISDIVTPNPFIFLPYIPDDDPPPDNTKTGIETFIPKEWTIGMIIFVGSAVVIPILIVVYRKKKNPTGI